MRRINRQSVRCSGDRREKTSGRFGWNIYKNGGRVDVGIDAVEWGAKVEQLGCGRNFTYKHGL